jgi:DNA (cytosine-5)-methyltransferase 1
MCDNRATIVSFCSGYGGLEMGISRAFGGNTRTIAYVEREAFAIENLASKMQEGKLDVAPVYTDVTTFPYADFHGLVDIACAGIPCQPHSAAGKRKGGADERFLFDVFLEGIGLMQPTIVFIENVEGLLSSKMPDGSLCIGYVLRGLENVGYRVETPDKRLSLGIFSAAECLDSTGKRAPHQRKRVFIMAHRDGERGQLPNTRRLAAEQMLVSDGKAWRDDRWPARPGESQHDWEPPRVV